jgi:hypothetical protein
MRRARKYHYLTAPTFSIGSTLSNSGVEDTQFAYSPLSQILAERRLSSFIAGSLSNSAPLPLKLSLTESGTDWH